MRRDRRTTKLRIAEDHSLWLGLLCMAIVILTLVFMYGCASSDPYHRTPFFAIRVYGPMSDELAEKIDHAWHEAVACWDDEYRHLWVVFPDPKRLIVSVTDSAITGAANSNGYVIRPGEIYSTIRHETSHYVHWHFSGGKLGKNYDGRCWL